MFRWLKHSVTVLALYAMTLHVLLAALAPTAIGGGSTVDPFSVICHSSSPNASGDPAPRSPALIPGKACEHCNLCSAMAPPSAPDVALAIEYAPTRVLHVFRPAEMRAPADIASEPKLARGPPHLS
jgi:hypothetical protein